MQIEESSLCLADVQSYMQSRFSLDPNALEMTTYISPSAEEDHVINK